MTTLAIPDKYETALREAASDYRASSDQAKRDLDYRRNLRLRGSIQSYPQERDFVGAFRASTGEILTGDERTLTTPTDLLRGLLLKSEHPVGDYRAVWGYGSVFDVGYMFADEFGPYVEIMDRSAFDDTLTIPDIQISLLRSHAGLGLATTRSRRMSVGVDDHGLGFAAYLSLAESDGRDLVTKLENGSATTDTSIGGYLTDGQWNEDMTTLRITRWGLSRGEISAVRAGANPAGWVTLATDPVLVDRESLAEVIQEKA